MLCSSSKNSKLWNALIAVIFRIIAIAIDKMMPLMPHYPVTTFKDIVMLFCSSKISKLSLDCYR